MSAHRCMKREAKILMGPFWQKAWRCPICDELTADGSQPWASIFDFFARYFWRGMVWSK